MMTIEDIRRRVEEIRKISDDDELAHSMEDRLRDDVLKEVLHGNTLYKELAAEALLTSGIKFSRWFA